MAEEGGVFCAGSINQTGTLYAGGAGKDDIQKRFDAQIQIFLKNDLDFLIAEVGLCFFSFFCKSCSLRANVSYFLCFTRLRDVSRSPYTPLCNRPSGIFIFTGFLVKTSLGWPISHWVGLFSGGFFFHKLIRYKNGQLSKMRGFYCFSIIPFPASGFFIAAKLKELSWSREELKRIIAQKV